MATAGRKRDTSKDQLILDATLAVLAERGYEGTTIDLVAAKAHSARATVYRRWPTKSELVLDAVNALSRSDMDRDELPDTETLRGDLVAMILPLDDAQQQIRIQSLAALLALARTDGDLAQAAQRAGIGPWIDLGRELIQRAVDRGEYPAPANVNVLAELIPMMCLARAAQRLPITRAFSIALIDGVLLPALRGGT